MECIILYVLLGLGLRGGFPHWNNFFRSLYAIVFPLHELLFRVLFSVPVKSILKSETFWAWVVGVGIFLAFLTFSE